MQRALSLMIATLCACGPVALGKPDGESSGETGSSTHAPSSTTTTSTAPTSTGIAAPGTTTGGPGSTSDASSGAAATSTDFIAPLDGGFPESCSGYAQDCPAGQKCVPYADDGGGSWNNTKCMPVPADPAGVGEPCVAPDGGTAGNDNCDVGAWCWDVDSEGMGTCVELCGGSWDEPTCAQGHLCADLSRGGTNAGICIAMCDPIEQDCDPSDVCIGNPNGEGFLCVLDASGEEGQLHDPCMFANACDPGLLCNDPSAATECDPNATGCCEPFCDLTKPNTCPGQNQICHPYYEEGTAPPDLEHIGYCALP